MERLLRHEGESRDTARLTWSHHRRLSGGQGAHREVGSERLEENHRVVINGSTSRVMNRSAKGGEWSSPHYGGEGTWVPLRRTKVFADDTVGKSVSDSGRPGIVQRAGMAGIVRHSQTKGRANRERKTQPGAAGGRCGYKRKRSSDRCSARSRIGAWYS